MSELTNLRRQAVKRQLRMTASLSTLLAVVSAAQASEADRPIVWIELGAQFEQGTDLGQPFLPPFTDALVRDGFTSPAVDEDKLNQSFGGESRISYQAPESNWSLTAAVRFGRATGGAKTHEQTPGGGRTRFLGTYPFKTTEPFAKLLKVDARNDESHMIVDFQAGRDLGLGMFANGNSTFSFGLRAVQFSSKRTLDMRADPDLTIPSNLKYAIHHHTYHVTSLINRSFHGIGPSVAWNGAVSLLENAPGGELTADWAINASVLFGRQKISGHHQTVAGYYKTASKYRVNTTFVRSNSPKRSRFITVPNVGALAGFSFHFPNAKISIGYRADFFFGAMDGGIDAAKKENVGFYGPFASVSVGIGG